VAEHYDVVVAGAGPAGAQCARDLASRGRDVLVLETEAEDEFPRQSNKSTAGTFAATMGGFGVPDEVVMNYTDDVVLESPTRSYVDRQPGAVLEFADFKRWLVRDGRDRGAEYRFDARATAPVTEGEGPRERVVGVRYDGDEEVSADLVVDATGPAAPLARKLGVCDLEREHQAIGVEWEMEGVAVDHPDYADLTDAMMLRLDHHLAPGGYSWIFHTGGDRAKVGLCYIQNESHERYGDEGMRIDDYLERWEDEDPRLADATRIEGEQHRGSAHIQPPDRLSTGGFMAVGDTVPTIDPLWGEGIYKCMESGRAAAITADRCLMGERDVSAEATSVYDDLWHTRVAPNIRTRLAMTRLLYLADNDRYDRLMDDLSRLDDATLSAANGGGLRALASLVHLDDLPLLARFARERLFGSAPA
jgi:digeranylgeranylglycerophospholipid reductase